MIYLGIVRCHGKLDLLCSNMCLYFFENMLACFSHMVVDKFVEYLDGGCRHFGLPFIFRKGYVEYLDGGVAVIRISYRKSPKNKGKPYVCALCGFSLFLFFMVHIIRRIAGKLRIIILLHFWTSSFSFSLLGKTENPSCS